MRLIGAVSVAAIAMGFAPFSPISSASAQTAGGDLCPAEGQLNAFNDDNGNIHEPNINCGEALDIINGKTSTTFDPDGDLTRGQAASLLVQLVEAANCGDELTVGTDQFPDDETSVHEENINKAANNDILEGFDDGTFRPGIAVTRAQFASIVVQAVEETTGEQLDDDGQDDFDDDDDSVHESNIEKANDNNLLEGFGNRRFAPQDDIDRDQAATILIRTAEFLFDEGFFNCDGLGANGNDVLNVEPSADQTRPCVEGIDEDTPTDDVTITVTDLDDGEAFRLTLVDSDNVDEDEEGETTFTEDTASPGLVDTGDVAARIVSVNGESVDPAQSVGSVEPENGTITFVIDCGDAESIVPVVFEDSEDSNTGLNIDENGRPTEEFGIGGTITFGEPTARDDATVTTNATNVEQGDTFSITVEGEDIESVTVSGDCIDTQTFDASDDTDGSTTDDSFDFDVVVNQDANTGNCVITVTTTFTDASGTADETDTININVTERATEATATDLPELVEAEFVRTLTASDGSETTVVRFTFDETITGGADAIDETNFFLVTAGNERFQAINTAVREDTAEDNSVLVEFDIDSDQFSEVTMATVDDGAVEDTEGNTNPEGDTDLNGGESFAAGETEAPDLVSVDNFRDADAAGAQDTGETLVDFTFDEEAFVVDGAGFILIFDDGERADCTAEDDEDGTLGEDFTGDGTTTITVVCVDLDLDGNGEEELARGVVEEGAVSDEDQVDETNTTDTVNDTEGNTNPLMATEENTGGTTIDPDLVSVTFDEEENEATFVFDDTVTSGNFADFNVFDVNGEQFEGTGFSDEDTDADDNTVIVEFDNADLSDATGASVDAGAVSEAGGSATNQEDEVGVAARDFQAGETIAPDLLEVTREVTGQSTDIQGNTTDTEITITFVFDEEVENAMDGSFFIFDEEGNRTILDNCTAGTDTGTTDIEDNEVDCVVTDGVDGIGTGGTQTGDEGFTEAQEAVLGTVDQGAVTDEALNENNEADEVVTDSAA